MHGQADVALADRNCSWASKEGKGSRKHEPTLGELEEQLSQRHRSAEVRTWRHGECVTRFKWMEQWGESREITESTEMLAGPWCWLRPKISDKESRVQHLVFLQIWNTIMLWVITQQFGEINTYKR